MNLAMDFIGRWQRDNGVRWITPPVISFNSAADTLLLRGAVVRRLPRAGVLYDVAGATNWWIPLRKIPFCQARRS